ncbi:unnamed protein product [Orchesella dallaii]|uniref:DOMON domain-containing protein n=1 Tax=Orchesella dallaii TaxID=48710 RepID=A0ABP1PKM3_9HEXA
MERLFRIFLIVSVVFSGIQAQTSSGSSNFVNPEPFRHRAILDPRGRYQLEWEVDFDEKTVIFNVTVQTKGFVGFGLSKKGKMLGADIVIGGIDEDGQAYFSDRHAIGHQLPEIDESQDWNLISSWERENTTFLSFSRAFDTCDPDHDLPITDDLITLIWSYGENDDDLQYHFHNRGAYQVYLLDPDYVPKEFREEDGNGINVQNGTAAGNLNVFSIGDTMTLPLQDTLYWCSFHKVPTTTKQHAVGFSTIIPNPDDRPHIHHLVIYRCYAPPGMDPDEFFGEAAASEGSECYLLSRPNPLPTQYCREGIQTWAVGGRPYFFPEHVGLPLSENGTEYWMMQVHYDNVSLLTNRTVDVRLEAYYTDDLRENDLGVFWVGELSHASASLLIPPSSRDHIMIGHCAEECTRKMFPEEGINIIGAMVHTHISGTGIRALQFRNNEELPWIAADDNYSFNYQQFRMLREERKVLPGDLLSNRCTYDTTDRNGSVITGGYPTRQEMCATLFYYYNRVSGYTDCRSDIREPEYMNLLGIQNASYNDVARQTLVNAPAQYAGMPVQDYANEYIDFTIELREELQWQHIFQRQVSICEDVVPRSWPEGTKGVNRQNVDTSDTEHETALPRGIPRYRRPEQCTRK